jgi:hypothetical protein
MNRTLETKVLEDRLKLKPFFNSREEGELLSQNTDEITCVIAQYNDLLGRSPKSKFITVITNDTVSSYSSTTVCILVCC